MMRITRRQKENTVARYQVEGSITQQTVGELKAACEASFANHPTLLLDLSGVRFVDAAGIEGLHSLTRRGAGLIGCSGFLTEMLQANSASETETAGSHPQEHSQEAQLLAGLRDGKQAAFETLVRQYGGRMLATARRLLKTDADAHDAVQEAFLSAFRAIDQFTGTAKLSTWLHRIVVNTALMKLRSQRRRPEESIEDLLPHFDEQGEWLTAPTGWETPSEILLQRQETRALVRQCIARLPDTYRTILLLRDIEDLETEEVARTLGITANAVKIRLHRARQALRTLLEQELAATTRDTPSPSAFSPAFP
jgi:RNA polymerase sigma-70 factor (ECF subfamily)